MGCDHLICKKCKVGYNLENGSVFWVMSFLNNHWHKRKKPREAYFEVKFDEFPKHLTIRHRIPAGYISTTEPAIHTITSEYVSGNCFHREHLLRDIRKKYFAKGEEAFVVRKNNLDHDWMRS